MAEFQGKSGKQKLTVLLRLGHRNSRKSLSLVKAVTTSTRFKVWGSNPAVSGRVPHSLCEKRTDGSHHWKLFTIYAYIKNAKNEAKVYLSVDVTILRAGFPGGSVGTESTYNAGDVGSPVHGGLLCPPPGDLSDPGTEPVSLMSPALAGPFFTTNIFISHNQTMHQSRKNAPKQ